MDKPYLHKLSTPTLENPVFVQGLPGFGNVGRIAAHLLIKFFDASYYFNCQILIVSFSMSAKAF